MEPQRTIRPVGERWIQVIDGAFDPAFVAMLDRWLHKLAFVREDYDNGEATAFLHFVHDIALDKLDAQPLYRQLHSIVTSSMLTVRWHRRSTGRRSILVPTAITTPRTSTTLRG